MVLATLMVAILSSCEKEHDHAIWDIYPVKVRFFIQDKAGNNLLEENASGNWMGADFKVIYEGKEYPVQWENHNQEDNILSPQGNTRDYLPHFRGLTPTPTYVSVGNDEWMKKGYCLTFGEFDGAQNQDLTLRFIVPDSEEEYLVHIKHSYKFDTKKDRPVIKNEMTVNGEKVEYDKVYVVLPPR